MIYLDNAATTRPSKAAADAALAVMTEDFGNPSSLHTLGYNASRRLDEARKSVADVLNVREDEICFTSGGTEANNLAVIGAARARRKRGNRIVTTAVEHASVMDSMKALEEDGFDVVYIKPDGSGNIDMAEFERAVDEKTILVSCMYVNNETGSIFPVDRVKAVIQAKNAPALYHVDAVQAFGKMNVLPRKYGADLLTVSAHKVHGVKGCGALFIKKGTTIRRRSYGGEQELKLRAGTQATPNIAAFGAVCEAMDPRKTKEKLTQIQRAFIKEICKINGVVFNSPVDAAAQILNISIPGYRSETLLYALAQREIYVSSGSACKKGQRSHVLSAQGLPNERIDSAMRISFCDENIQAEAVIFAAALREIMAEIAHL